MSVCLGKCQTDNAILSAKLASREQHFDVRMKELHGQYSRVKRHYEHMSACVKEFHSKLYQRKRLKTEAKDDALRTAENGHAATNYDSNDDVVEIVMVTEPALRQS